jgi:arsenate reductase
MVPRATISASREQFATDMLSLVPLLTVLTTALAADTTVPLNPALQKYVAARTAEFDQIPAERKAQLNQVANYVRGCAKSDQTALLIFVCTHNSRRSFLAQIWAQTAAAHFGLSGVQTFSGGTEATAFNPRAIAVLRRAGFDITEPKQPPTSNPHYQVRYQQGAPSLECFSKVYNDAVNPQRDFCAVMVCSTADQACPLVEGAALRLAIPYDDPKVFDDTPAEAQKYDERSEQIAREMLYLFSKTKEPLK